MIRTALSLIAAVSLTACGGGGLGSLFSNPVTVQMASTPSESGHAWSTGGVSKSTTGQLIVGDSLFNNTAHGFLRFSLALVPAGAKITEARLVMGQESIVGSPYADVGPTMRVDHVNMLANFDSLDMTAPIVIQPLGVLSTDSLLEAKEVDVKSAVQVAVDNAFTDVDFRIRMDIATNGDNGSDWARLNNENDDGGSGIRPTLIVTYEE